VAWRRRAWQTDSRANGGGSRAGARALHEEGRRLSTGLESQKGRSAATVLSHRGVSGPEPENTLAAFSAAASRGVEGIELDVRQTGDGVLVVTHDADVAGSPVAGSTYADLQAQKNGLCTLGEALGVIASTCLLDIEIKIGGFEEAVLHAAERARPLDSYIVSSFDPLVVARAKEIDPRVRAGLLLDERPADRHQPRLAGSQAVATLGSCHADVAVPHWTLLEGEFLRQLGQAGFPVWVWTVNSTELLDTLFHTPEVEAIITDHPQAAMRVRDGGPQGR
jgi:glycerophosphoryl diester phosphodiesterase